MSEFPFLRAYYKASECLMALNPNLEMPVTIAHTLLGTVLWSKPEWEDPMSIEELAWKLDKPVTTVHTHIRYIGQWYREGKPGLGLVYTERHFENGRKKTVRLTAKGRALVTKLEGFYGGEPHRTGDGATL